VDVHGQYSHAECVLHEVHRRAGTTRRPWSRRGL
jgi:hypothetical protein